MSSSKDLDKARNRFSNKILNYLDSISKIKIRGDASSANDQSCIAILSQSFIDRKEDTKRMIEELYTSLDQLGIDPLEDKNFQTILQHLSRVFLSMISIKDMSFLKLEKKSEYNNRVKIFEKALNTIKTFIDDGYLKSEIIIQYTNHLLKVSGNITKETPINSSLDVLNQLLGNLKSIPPGKELRYISPFACALRTIDRQKGDWVRRVAITSLVIENELSYNNTLYKFTADFINIAFPNKENPLTDKDVANVYRRANQ